MLPSRRQVALLKTRRREVVRDILRIRRELSDNEREDKALVREEKPWL